MTTRLWRVLVAVITTVALLAIPAVASAEFTGPIFGLGIDGDGNVIAAEVSQGVVSADGSTVIAALPGITDTTASDQGWLWAITGEPDSKLYKIHPDGSVHEFADLGAFEEKRNPHPAFVESNPYGVADLGHGEAVVADAAGNTLLKVNAVGKVSLIAVFPDELVSTGNAKALVEEAFGASCDALPPDAPPDAVDVCGLPPMIPAESVPTGVVIGPGGDYFVGELKGFPAPVGESKLWRIDARAHRVDCAVSPRCSVAHDGFTSIVDLAYDSDSVFVAEMSEKTWLAVELALFEGLPLDPGVGTINECRRTCGEIHTGIHFLSALAVDRHENLWYAELFGPVTQN